MVKSLSVALFALWSVSAVAANPLLISRATECKETCVARCNTKSGDAQTTCLASCETKSPCTSSAAAAATTTSTKKASTTAAAASPTAVAASTKTTTTKAQTTTTTKAQTTSTKSAAAATSSAASSSSGACTVGYATLNGGTTGGAGGDTVTVTTASQFVSAVGASGAKIVYLNGFFSNVGAIKVASDKTIIGVGANSGFTGSSLVVKGVSNVIIRNIKMQLCQGGDNDCVTLNAAKNVWIDHNDFSGDMAADKDKYDGLVDVTHGSSFVTISWNYFHNHHKTSLVGHSDTNGDEDVSIRATYFANYFQNIGSRVPSVRFATVHVFSNYYNDISGSGVNTRMGAQVLIESNVFVNAVNPATFKDSTKTGFCVVRNNDFGGASADCPTGTLTSVPYSYSLIATSNVKATVSAGAGTGKI